MNSFQGQSQAKSLKTSKNKQAGKRGKKKHKSEHKLAEPNGNTGADGKWGAVSESGDRQRQESRWTGREVKVQNGTDFKLHL